MKEERIALFRRDLACTGSSGVLPGKVTAKETDKIEANTWSSSRLLVGYLAGIFMGLAYAASLSCSQALGGFVPAFQLNAFRFGVQILSVAPVVILRRPAFPTKKKERLFLGLACIIPSVDNIFYYESTVYIPVGTVGALGATLMLLLSALVAIVLRENLSLTSVVSVILALIGIICLTQPAVLFKFFGHISEPYTIPVCVGPAESKAKIFNDSLGVSDMQDTRNSTNELNEVTVAEQGIIRNPVKGYLLVLCGCLGHFVNGQIFYRFLPETDRPLTILCISLFGVLLSLIGMFIAETPTFPGSSRCVAILFGHSISAALAGDSFTFTASTVSPVFFSLLNSLKLVFFLVAQFTVLKHVNPGHGNHAEIAGGILVLCAITLDPMLTIYKQQKAKLEQE